MKSRLLENSILSIVLQVTNYIAPFIVLPYLSRVIGLDGFGMVSYTLSLCLIVYIFTDYGFNISGPEFISKNSSDIKEISKFTNEAITIKVIMLLVACFFVFISDYFFNKFNFSFGAYLVITSQALQVNWFFQGLEKFKLITISSVLSKIFYILLVFNFVNDASDINNVYISLSVGNFVAIIVSFGFMYKLGYRYELVLNKNLFFLLRYNFGFFFSRLSLSLYSTFNTIILGMSSSFSRVAEYSSVEKLYQAIQSISYSISQAFFPYLSRTKDISTLVKYIILVMVLAIPLLTFFIYFDISRVVVVYFFGEEFSSASKVLDVFLITSIVNFLSINSGYPLFSCIDRIYLVNYTVYIAAIIQVLMITFLFCNEAISPVNLSYCVLISEFVVLTSRLSIFYIFHIKEID